MNRTAPPTVSPRTLSEQPTFVVSQGLGGRRDPLENHPSPSSSTTKTMPTASAKQSNRCCGKPTTASIASLWLMGQPTMRLM